ncbi:DUF421 domain-containing protein [Clostridium sp.]|uniref:DUF421 domain-containing protein n=1 Tax=Clostridium sp. TaxID=1506 RepID=UPI002FC83216
MNEGLVVLVRGVIGFFTLLIFARILGKQQISQLDFFDYVLGITIGSIAATLTTDLSSRAWPHWVGLLTWAALGYLMEIITNKWIYIGKYIDGEPTVVIMNGKIMESALKKMKFRAADLLQMLRNKDVFDLNQVEYAIIEPNGQLSVLKKSEYQPLTPKDMNKKVPSASISRELVYNGVVFHQNLQEIGKDERWLMKELKKHDVKQLSEVFLVLIDENGVFYIDKYKDHIKNMIDTGDYKGPY